MSRVSIENDMPPSERYTERQNIQENNLNEQSEDGDQVSINMPHFILGSQFENDQCQSPQTNIAETCRQRLQVESVRDIFEEQNLNHQTSSTNQTKPENSIIITKKLESKSPSNQSPNEPNNLQYKDTDNNNNSVIGDNSIRFNSNPMFQDNNFLSIAATSPKDKNNFSSQNQPEDKDDDDSPVLIKSFQAQPAPPTKGYSFGEHPQTIEALRNGFFNLGSCNDILHKTAATREREREIQINDMNFKFSKEDNILQQQQQQSNQYQQLHKVGSYQVPIKKISLEDPRRGQSLGQLHNYWNSSLRHIDSQKVTPPKSEEDHNGIQQTNVPLSCDSEQLRDGTQNRLCMSNEILEIEIEKTPQAGQIKEDAKGITNQKPVTPSRVSSQKQSGRYPFRIMPLKDSEDSSYYRKFGQLMSQLDKNNKSRKSNDRGRFSLSKRSIMDNPVDYENLLYSESNSSSFNLSQGFTDTEDHIPWYILNPLSKLRIVWNIFLLMVMLFNALLVPLRLGFYGDDQSQFYIVDLVIDSLFILEFIYSFFSAYENQDGKMIVDFKYIIVHYLKGWFTIDFFSSIMVFVVGSTINKNVMRMFRIPKIYKQVSETRLFQMLNSGRIMRCILFLKTNGHYTDILRFSIIIIFLIHITGSIWYFIATLQPQVNWYRTFYDTNEGPDSQKYTAAVYYVLSVLTTVGYGNIVSSNKSEYSFTILFMFFAVIIYSWILGVLTYSFYKINEKGAILKDRFIYYNQIVSNYKLSRELQEKLLKTVQVGFNSTSNRRLDIFQHSDILQDLPDETKGIVCENIFGSIIKKIPFLQSKSLVFAAKLIQKVTSLHMNPGDILYEQGTVTKYVYFLVKGRVVTKIQSSFQNFKTLVYVEGSFFGEVDMLLKRERRQSAYAETTCEVWRIDKENFIELLNQNEEIQREVIQQAIKKEELMMKEEMKLLRSKLEENPSLNSLIFEELLIYPFRPKRKTSTESVDEDDQNSIGDLINEEIVIQSKKRAYNSVACKEISMTDIIKISAKRLAHNNEKKAIDQLNTLNCTQSVLKAKALDQMIVLINQHETVNLNPTSVAEFLGIKKILSKVQNSAVLNLKQPTEIFLDKELEDVIQMSAQLLRNNR